MKQLQKITMIIKIINVCRGIKYKNKNLKVEDWIDLIK
jgi:hypothetical protein